VTHPSDPGISAGAARAGFWLLVVISLALGYLVIRHLDVGIGDEDVHRFQINWFIEGRYEIFQYVTVLPVYHLVVAQLAKWTGLVSLDGLRLVHLLFASAVIPAFYRLGRALYPREAASRTLQFLFIPFVFPLYFLTYTDLPALLFVLLMVERTLRNSYAWAGIFGLVAVAMRQPNIAWVGFAVGLIVLQVAREEIDRGCLVELGKRAGGLLGAMALFLVFILWNGGIAMGDAEQHPLSLNLSNLYFCLMVAWLLFLPFNIEQLGGIRTLISRHRWILMLLIGAFGLYFFTYAHPHKYNSPELAFYRHNLLIHYTSDYTAIRVLAFVPIAWMSLSFVTAAIASDYRAEMSFLPMPLIEPRYYIAALTLFLVLRPPMSRAATVVTLAWYIPTSLWILYNISRQNFFI
jgi:alpha-1,2-glucosyltransferase